ncbi:uncharacterized protein LOC109518546 isoform X2 [Hippocampus comes]|uniref:uncharacterized protein LOC109518546 isoform X2 n=1 Tax=Hippocampus comes TaxID=109280 RepID=UPI00094E9001|nr:PREDICTED: uncharacterized protein LOC109518546 isoform X2 [Hippocampus comes]
MSPIRLRAGPFGHGAPVELDLADMSRRCGANRNASPTGKTANTQKPVCVYERGDVWSDRAPPVGGVKGGPAGGGEGSGGGERPLGSSQASKRPCRPSSPDYRPSMESAEALAANQKSRRNVTIEITNLTNGFVLRRPRVHLESGDCHSPPQPTVRPMRTEVCNFNKTDAAASGAVGVLTYEIHERGSAAAKLAIMFSVPYDFTFYKSWMGVGIFPTDRETDGKLYKEMYENKEQRGFVRQLANGNGLTYESGKMDVKVNMSPLGRAIMKVELWDLHFHP